MDSNLFTITTEGTESTEKTTFASTPHLLTEEDAEDTTETGTSNIATDKTKLSTAGTVHTSTTEETPFATWREIGVSEDIIHRDEESLKSNFFLTILGRKRSFFIATYQRTIRKLTKIIEGSSLLLCF